MDCFHAYRTTSMIILLSKIQRITRTEHDEIAIKLALLSFDRFREQSNPALYFFMPYIEYNS